MGSSGPSKNVFSGSGLFFVSNFPQKLETENNSIFKSGKDDLVWCMRHMLRFGRFTGLFPFTGVFQSDLYQLKHKICSSAGIWSLVCIACIFVSLGIGLLGVVKLRGTNATEWAWASDSAAFYLIGLLCYIHFLRRGPELVRIFQKWSSLPLNCNLYDKTLGRDVILSGALLVSGILENSVWTYNGFTQHEPPNDGSSILRNFFENSRTQWLNLVDYSPIIPLFIFFSNKLCMWGWNLTDIFVISMARALSGKFKAFNEVARKEISIGKRSTNYSREPITKLEMMLLDHQLLRELLKDVALFLSPLLFLLYTGNLFFICLQIHLGVTGKATKEFWGSSYAFWAFLHLFVKLFVTTSTAAKVNYQVHQFADILYEAPDYMDSSNARKTREYLGTKAFGLDGLGCFVIRTPFMLSLLSFVFTFEIVLFQSTFPSCGSFNRTNYATLD